MLSHKKRKQIRVKFALENEAGEILNEYVSDENGLVSITGLANGKYILRETETLEGFSISEEPIVIVIDTNYVIPDELPKWTNYPIIKTGTEIKSPYLWIGIGLLGVALACCVFVLIYRKRNKANK